MKRKSQLFALLLALCLAVSVLAVPAWAENAENNGDSPTTSGDTPEVTPDPAVTPDENEDKEEESPENPEKTPEEIEEEQKRKEEEEKKKQEEEQKRKEEEEKKKQEEEQKRKEEEEKKKQEEAAAAAAAAKPTSSDLSYPSSVDLGTLTKGATTGLTKTFTIRNNSSRPIVLNATVPNSYSITGASGTLAANSSNTVTVTLNSASSAGSFDRTLSISASFTDSSETYNFSIYLYATVKDDSYSLTVDPSSKDLGKLKEGYEEKTAKETEITVTVKNNGGSALNLNGFKGDDHFTVTAVNDKYARLESGKSAEFKIVPKQSLSTGTYTDTITFQTSEGVSATFKPTVVVEKALDPLTVEPATVDFGSVEEGYVQPSAQTVTVKNNSERAVRLEQPTSYSYEFSQLSVTSLAAGGSATFTIRPRAGLPQNSYDGVVVLQAGSETAKLNVRFTVSKKAGPSSFSDVAADSTFAADIAYVSQQGLMSGKADGLFKPNDPITRGQLVTILYRLEGQPAVSGEGFSDVAASSYCANAVKWAAATGVTTGGKDGTFKPDDPITREQLATFLYRYNNHKGYPIANQADLSKFTDGASAASYAKDALSWANGVGLVNGTSDGRLNPSGGATRGQAAAILHRFCVSIGK